MVTERSDILDQGYIEKEMEAEKLFKKIHKRSSKTGIMDGLKCSIYQENKIRLDIKLRVFCVTLWAAIQHQFN